jgi:phosphoketolase
MTKRSYWRGIDCEKRSCDQEVIQNMKIRTKTLNRGLLRKIDTYGRAANYLSVGQNYLFDHPLLKKPLKLAHIKPRLLGRGIVTAGLAEIAAGSVIEAVFL